MLKNIEIYINSLFRCFAQVLANLFRFKMDIELSQLGRFFSSMAREFKNLFIYQTSLKHNERYDFRGKRMAFFIRHVKKAHITDFVQLIRGVRTKTGIIIIIILFTYV